MTEVVAEEPVAKSGRKGLLLLLLVVLAAGGGGFGVGFMGLLPIPGGDTGMEEKIDPDQDKPVDFSKTPTFHNLPELVIPLGKESGAQFLRARIFLEINPSYADILRETEPRIVDTLNIFLRSIDERDTASILAMEKLRSEMLRRIRLVAGDQAVNAVLIGEFLLR